MKALHIAHCKSPISVSCRYVCDNTLGEGMGEFFNSLLKHRIERFSGESCSVIFLERKKIEIMIMDADVPTNNAL